MLDEMGVHYRYREYREEPLSLDELQATLRLLDMQPHELLRPKESAAAGLGADSDPHEILQAMTETPTLIQRPIMTNGERAILSRPADLLVAFLGN